MNGDLPARKFPAHPTPVRRHNQPVVLFVTSRLADASLTLTRKEMQAALVQAWAEACDWQVGSFLLMPDHAHYFCVPGVPEPLGIKAWCKFWKGRMRRILALEHTIWQRDGWDTQMRDYDHYAEKRSYVRMNPVRKGLVAAPEDWPWQGDLNVIRW